MFRQVASRAASQQKVQGLSWFAIVRLGLVQASLGSIVVLTNSTLNRVMVVELSLAAIIPGLLVGIHYAVQLSRPLWGHRSDVGRSRTSWILGGLALLAVSGTAAAGTTFLFETSYARRACRSYRRLHPDRHWYRGKRNISSRPDGSQDRA